MKPEKINVVFVTTLFSPFQIELFNKINTDNRISYKLIFTKNSFTGRGDHWNSVISKSKDVLSIIKKNKILSFYYLYERLKIINPDLIIIGQIRGFIPMAVKLYSIINRSRFIFWLEQPFPKPNKLYWALKDLDCYFNLLGCKNVIGIGDRATKYYSKFAKTYNIPYAQDLKFINSKYLNKKEKFFKSCILVFRTIN